MVVRKYIDLQKYKNNTFSSKRWDFLYNQSMETKIFLIRHAQSEANTNPFTVWGRNIESPLTLTWNIQAHKLWHYLWEKYGCTLWETHFVSSPSVRTIITAEIVSWHLWRDNRSLILDPDLLEVDQWEWSWRSIREVRTPEVLSQIKNNPDFRPPGGESNREVFERMYRVLHKVTQYWLGKTTFLHTHGLATRILVKGILDSDTPIRIENTGITELHYSPNSWFTIHGDIWTAPHLNN